MILGIDIGTTSVKAILLDREAQIIGEGACPHDTHSAHPGWAEGSPDDWWSGAVLAVKQALAGHDPSTLQGIGVSGMVPTVILLDSAGQVIRPSIQQNDARAVREIEELAAQFPQADLFRRTGATWNQQVVAPKLLWLRRNEPEAWKRVSRVVGSYEYLVRCLTGVTVCEANWALESGLWDVGEECWHTDIIKAIGLNPDSLPMVRHSWDIVGQVAQRAAMEMGLPEGVPVIAGGADHICSILPAGAVRPGQAVIKLGGAGDLLLTVDGFRPVESLYIDYHCIPGLFVVNGCMATSGSALKWFVRECASGCSFHDLDQEASVVPPGCDGLVTLPYFLGEKTPIHDPLARGTVVGLTLFHSRAHIYRSILEGVAFGFRHHIEVLRNASHSIDELFITDGGAQSDLWCGILASVLDSPITRPGRAQLGSAMGVALAAGTAVQSWTWEDALSTNTQPERFHPEEQATRTYDRLYAVYRDTYARLFDVYKSLGRIAQSPLGKLP